MERACSNSLTRSLVPNWFIGQLADGDACVIVKKKKEDGQEERSRKCGNYSHASKIHE
jgi:hypothetical protein